MQACIADESNKMCCDINRSFSALLLSQAPPALTSRSSNQLINTTATNGNTVPHRSTPTESRQEVEYDKKYSKSCLTQTQITEYTHTQVVMNINIFQVHLFLSVAAQRNKAVEEQVINTRMQQELLERESQQM